MKNELRKALLQQRRNIKNKTELDNAICKNLVCSDFFKSFEQILFYAALDDEINMDSCIEEALKLGKRVALPRCINSDGEMEFYYISSFDDVENGHFNVREPIADENKRVVDFSNSICIVPGISFDKNGYRLGYGKGYYDRFLQKKPSLSVGVCYNDLVKDELPINEFDIAVDYIITENGISSAK